MTSPQQRSVFESIVRDPGRYTTAIGTVFFFGLIFCFTGVGVGVAVAVHRTHIPCANGTTFSDGTTDFRCFSYPHAGEGTAFVVLSLVAGLILGMTCLLGLWAVSRSTATDDIAAADALASGGPATQAAG